MLSAPKRSRRAIAAVVDQIKAGVYLGSDRPNVLRQAIMRFPKGGTISMPGVYTGFLAPGDALEGPGLSSARKHAGWAVACRYAHAKRAANHAPSIRSALRGVMITPACGHWARAPTAASVREPGTFPLRGRARQCRHRPRRRPCRAEVWLQDCNRLP
jgi:hypothetical protein